MTNIYLLSLCLLLLVFCRPCNAWKQPFNRNATKKLPTVNTHTPLLDGFGDCSKQRVCPLFNDDVHVNVSQETHVGFTDDNGDKGVINIGVIVDMTSWLGKVVESCVSMAIHDYGNNSQYSSRIRYQIRDSKGDSLHSIAAALDLLQTVEVHALIVPTLSNKEIFMASLANKVKVPLLSFSAISPINEHPYYLQVGGDETTEFHGIAAVSEMFKWKQCVILLEDTPDGRQSQSIVSNILLQNKISVVYQSLISLSATNDQIVNDLRAIKKTRTSIIIVHLSLSLASQVFENAKMLGMMIKGFAWIVTSKTMDSLSFRDSSVHEVMQGALGFRSYISSTKLQNFTFRLRKEFGLRESNLETRELLMYGLWAYDSTWAIAYAVEKTGIIPNRNQINCNLLDSACLRVSDSGQALMNQISSNKFSYGHEIVNVIGNGEIIAGFWNVDSGFSKGAHKSNNPSSNSTLEPIIWPGIATTTPENQIAQDRETLKVVIPIGRKRPELVSWQLEEQTNQIIAEGFCVEVFRAAFEWLKSDINFEFFTFDGSYSDLVYQVHQEKYDVAVGDITILANRSEFVDFTSPYTDLGVGMVARLDNKDPWFFTKPLDRNLWIMCGFWFVVTGIVVWIIERPINEEFQGTLAHQLGTLMWFCVSTLVFAHDIKLRSSISRFVVGTWMIVLLVLTSSYTANLSSLLTVQKFKLTKSDSVGSANPLVEGQIVSNLNFYDYRLRPYHEAEDYVDALRRGSKKGGVGAIIDEIPYIKIFLRKYPNEYTIIETTMTTSGFGFAFRKGSRHVPEVSRAIAGLREDEKLLVMEKKWFARKLPILSQENQPPSINALTVENFSGLFLISGISIGLAVALLIVISLRQRFFRLRALAIQRVVTALHRFYFRMVIG